MRIFRTRTFTRWMRKSGVKDSDLTAAVGEMIAGLIDADLGGHVIKKRVSLPGRGKRVGARTLVATNKEDRWYFVFGFAKNERANIDQNELRALQELASDLLAQNDRAIADSLTAGEILEISHDQQDS
jgi:hypothetical protein